MLITPSKTGIVVRNAIVVMCNGMSAHIEVGLWWVRARREV